MAAEYDKILSVALNSEIRELMKIARKLTGLTEGPFARQAIIEKLVGLQLIEHPAAELLRQRNANAATPANGDAHRAG